MIEKASKQIIYEPPYYPEKDGREHKYLSHDIYIAELYGVAVHGGTGIIISDRKALTDVCYNDKANRVKYKTGAIKRGTKKAFYIETEKSIKNMECAVSLCGLSADNYFHLTIEILSRYEFVKRYIEQEKMPVLLDEDARKYPQFDELVRKILGDAKVVYVPKYMRVFCKRMIYPSTNTWMPNNVKRKNDFRMSDNLMAKSAVDNIRKATEDFRQARTEIKIFISRKNATISRIINEDEVSALFEKRGYRIVYVEDLTFKEQVELFSSVACVVGASGAALTNLVYCNPGTVFGCIIPRKYDFCIYSSIAHMVGCKVLFLNAKITRRGETISTEQWRVNIEDCKGYIDELEIKQKQN